MWLLERDHKCRCTGAQPGICTVSLAPAFPRPLAISPGHASRYRVHGRNNGVLAGCKCISAHGAASLPFTLAGNCAHCQASGAPCRLTPPFRGASRTHCAPSQQRESTSLHLRAPACRVAWLRRTAKSPRVAEAIGRLPAPSRPLPAHLVLRHSWVHMRGCAPAALGGKPRDGGCGITGRGCGMLPGTRGITREEP